MPAAARLPSWGVVQSVPVLAVGGDDGARGHQFVTVMDARRLGGGGLAVAEHPSQEIRLFSPAGDLVRVLGGRGDGPGEFRDIRSLAVRRGDTLHAFDARSQRVSILTPEGRFVGGVASGGGDGLLEDLTAFTDGRWGGKGRAGLRSGPVGSIVRTPKPFYVLSPDLRSRTFLAEAPGPMSASFAVPGGEVGTRAAPFTPVPRYAIHGDRMYLSFGDHRDVPGFTSEGTLRVILRMEEEGRRVEAADRERWLEGVLRQVPESAHAEVRRLLATLPAPERLPLHDRILADPRGRIWLERYEPPFGPGRVWVVVDPERGTAGRVTVPAGLELFQVGEDFVVAGWAGELDVVQVGVFPLRPAEG